MLNFAVSLDEKLKHQEHNAISVNARKMQKKPEARPGVLESGQGKIDILGLMICLDDQSLEANFHLRA